MMRKPSKEEPSFLHGLPGMIESMESRGQQSFVDSETLPVVDQSTKDILISWGIEFLGPVEDDPLFEYVKLPEGWKKVPTNHSMWSKLVDDKGVERASIFYKAAFYDRRASLDIKESK